MRSFRSLFALAPGVVLAFAAATQTANANVVYNYTGNDFTIVSAPFTTSDFVSASFTFANPLPADLPFTEESPALIAWSMSDQIYTVGSSNATRDDASFMTNQSGAITLWRFDSIGPNLTIFSSNESVAFDDETYLTNPANGNTYNVDTPGTWTATFNGFQGGTSSSPLPLIEGPLVAG
jgi:hypothetical protein